MTAGRKIISDKKDWNTPPKYANLAKEMLGEIILDPCSNEFSFIDSEIKYVLPTNGLEESWDFDTIFVNPPYGRNVENKTSIYNWIEKGTDIYRKRKNEILFLIPVSTNTRHFKDLVFKYGTGICFLKDTRLKFWLEGLEYKKGAPMACCFVYYGKDYNKFEELFSEYGKTFLINNI